MKKIYSKILLILCICVSITSIFSGNKIYAESDFEISAKSAILVDFNSGEVLFSQNENEKLEVASITKLMTILLTIEAIEDGRISLTDELIASEYASSQGGSQVFIDANSKYSVGKMLQSVIMASANDASVALAEHIYGSEKSFTDKMNERAKSLGMTGTKYANSTGLPAPMQFSTAKDTAVLLSKLIPSEIYHKYSSTWMDELVHPSGRKTEIVNTNKLTRYYKGCDSGKTGFTDEAGYCLSCSVLRDDMRLISVVIGAKSSKERFNQTVALMNYGFANFYNKEIVSTELPLGQISVTKSKVNSCDVFASEDFFGLVKKGQEAFYDVTLELPNSISAPLTNGDKVGKVLVTNNGVLVKEIDVIVTEDVEALSFGEAFNKVVKAW